MYIIIVTNKHECGGITKLMVCQCEYPHGSFGGINPPKPPVATGLGERLMKET